MTGQPILLAEQIVKLLADEEDHTADSAIRIAEILLMHRKLALLAFRDECQAEDVEARHRTRQE